MGPEFIVRVQKMTAGLALLAALFVCVYVSPVLAAALLAGAAWAIVNVWLIRRLVSALLRPGRPRLLEAAGLLLLKFPALYAAGYVLLRWFRLDPVWSLAGFTLLPAVTFLKALGRALIWSGWFERMPAAGTDGAPALVAAKRVRPGRGSRAAALLAVIGTLGIVAAIAVSAGSGETPAGEVAGPHRAATAEAVQAPGSSAENAPAGAAESSPATMHAEPSPAALHAESAPADHAGESAEEGEEEAVNELPNLVTVLYAFFHDVPVIRFLHHWENIFFSMLIALILIGVFAAGTRKHALIPGRFQGLLEYAVESLSGFIEGILGPRGREFVPFLGTLFLYILAMNLAGLIPGLKSPTANLNVTAGLALTVFLYVQYTGVRKNGVGGYFYHLMGSPKGITWAMVPLNIPLHIIEELARPMSLALRLFGNITGEDVLIFIFATLGIASVSFLHLPVGLPLQIPFLFLAILTSTIQALVFMLLSTIYFSLMLPHGEEHPEHH